MDLVKMFQFEECNRSRLTFSDATKIRLNPKTNRLELKSQGINPFTGDQKYPTDDNLYVKSWLTNPQALLGWTGFYADPWTQPTGTSVGYKLNDGTNDRYWSGSTWAVAGASDWNSEAQVVANISTFPNTKQLQIIVNLKTTDAKYTPTLSAVGMLMSLDMDGISGLVLDSLIPSLRTGLRTIIDFALRVDAGGLTFSLLDLETPYNVVSIEHVYNHTDDPNHLTDIFSSYDAGSKVVTVSASFDPGEVAWLRMKVEPEAAINWGDQDYIELEKIPAVVIDRVAITGNQIYGKAYVKDIVNKTAKVKRRPYRMQFEFDIMLIAEKNRTLLSMISQSLKHANDTPLLTWADVDEQVLLTTIREAEYRPRPDLRDRHSSTYSMRIDDVYLWLGETESAYLVENVQLALSAAELSGGPRYSGVSVQDPPGK